MILIPQIDSKSKIPLCFVNRVGFLYSILYFVTVHNIAVGIHVAQRALKLTF